MGRPVEAYRRSGRGGGGERPIRAPVLARAEPAPRGRQGSASAGPVRRRPGARRAAGRRGRRAVPRLLEEPGHRRDDRACWRRSPSSRDCGDRIEAMFRGERINVSEDRSVLHVALRMPQRARRWWSTASTWSRRCTRCSIGWRRSPTASAAATGRAHRPADPQRRQHRHRRLGPRPGDGLRGAAPLLRPRAARSASSRTSTRPTSSRRRATWTRRRRCSSSRPRRSRRSRR